MTSKLHSYTVHTVIPSRGHGGLMLCSTCVPGHPCRLTISARVSYPAFVPVIHVDEALTSAAGGYVEARAYVAETVTQVRAPRRLLLYLGLEDRRAVMVQ